jgi:hypothetical protein
MDLGTIAFNHLNESKCSSTKATLCWLQYANRRFVVRIPPKEPRKTAGDCCSLCGEMAIAS